MVIPVSEEFNDYSVKVNEKLSGSGFNSEVDLKNHNLNYKIREHSVSKIPVLMICGAKEVQNKTITIRRFGLEQQQTMSLDEAMDKLSLESRTPSI